jgi:Putative beta barrel porin-7 (BBP7)
MKRELLATLTVLVAATVGTAQVERAAMPPNTQGSEASPYSPLPDNRERSLPAPGAPAPVPAAAGCAPDSPCCSERVWGDAEYLRWFIKDSHVPPLVTKGSPNDSPPGALGKPGTVVLFGGDVDNEARSGGRFSAGWWFDDCDRFGVDGSFFFLAQDSISFVAHSDGSLGSPVLAIPYTDVTPGVPPGRTANAMVLAFTGLEAGAARVDLSSNLLGAEVNGRARLLSGPGGHLDVFTGFRYLRLSEAFDLLGTESSVNNQGFDFTVGTLSTFSDRNNFYGWQFGTEGELTWGRWFVDLRGKLALGENHQAVSIDGATAGTFQGQPQSASVGPFAFPSNLGHYSRETLSFVPEAGIDVGYQLTRHLRAKAGYTFIYWTDVVRPGDQIDPAMNNSLVPFPFGTGNSSGPARPSFSFKETDFWAQGVSLGFEFRY